MIGTYYFVLFLIFLVGNAYLFNPKKKIKYMNIHVYLLISKNKNIYIPSLSYDN